jgi:hypothetical protein
MFHSPFLGLIIWRKPRGWDRLMEIVIPPPVWKQEELAGYKRRQDMFYVLYKA